MIWFLLISLLGMMFIGLPVAFSLTLSGSLFLFVTKMKPLIVVAQRIIIGTDSFLLLAVPLFTLTGFLMEKGQISRRLVDWIQKLIGWMPGSLGMVGIACCAIFAALTGSGPATVAAIGSILLPSMIRSGYKPEDAAGLMAAAGALGPIIPPSVAMIVYGSTMSMSVTKMFIAGIVPGIFIAICLMICNYFLAKHWKLGTLHEKYTFKEFLVSTWNALGVLLLPVIILYGIYGGIFSPTEAATVSVIYSIIIMKCYGEFTIERLKSALLATVKTSAIVVFILGTSNLFAWLLSVTQAPKLIANALLPFFTTKYTYLIALTVFLFLVGAVMDTLPSIIILAPILVPIGIQLGCDPLHLALVFCINLIVGFITPPFGVNLFTAVTISGLSYNKVVKGVWPFMLVAMAAVVVLTFVPQIIMWLPNLLYSK